MKNISDGLRRAGQAFTATVCLSLFASSALATDYYVDSVDGADESPTGSLASPWRTLSKVNGRTFFAGDTISFKRGGAWTGSLYPKGNGTATARITWGAYGDPADPKPKIIAGAADQYAIQLWARPYTTIQDFDVTNNLNHSGTATGQDNKIGIYVGLSAAGVTATGIKILNNDIHHVRGYTAKINDNNTRTAGIYIEVRDSFAGERYKFHDLLIEGNYVHDLSAVGLYFKGPNWMTQTDKTWWSTGVVIRDNVFDHTGSDGLTLTACDAPVVENNVCLDAGGGTTNNDFGAIAGLWTCSFTRNTVFQFNEVARTRSPYVNGADGDSQAFDVDYGTEGTHTFQYNYTHDNVGGILIVMPKQFANSTDLVKTTIYRYNLSVNDGRSTNSSSQFPVWPVLGKSDVQIYNNVFYSTRPEGFRIRDNSATYFKNNIFYITTVGIYPTKTWFSNNCYWGHTANVTDPYKLVADPLFTGPLTGAGADGYLAANYDRFKLQAGSPCINKGGTIANNGGRDFWGPLPANSGNTDIGMHEVPNGVGSGPASVTIIDSAAAAVTYSSTTLWTHVNTDQDFYALTKSATDQLNQWCQVSFTGTNVSLYGRKFNNAAKLTVYVDGSPTPAAVVDCYSPTDMWRTELCRITGLSNAAHTARFVITAHNPVSTGNWVSLDYFQVASVTPPELPVVTDIDDTAGSYTGTWTTATTDPVQYGKTYHQSSTTGSSATFTFTGTGVRLLATRAGDCGKVNISIDGGAAVQKDLFMPIGFASSLDFRSTVFEINGLPNTTHTISITVDASANPQATGRRVQIDQIQALVGGVVVPTEVIVDNTDSTGVTLVGTWVASTFAPPFNGSNYLHDGNTGKGTKSIRFTPNLPTSGTYEVFAWWAASTDRATAVPFDITSVSGTTTVPVNQRLNGYQWRSLGTYTFNAGTGGSVLIRTTGTTDGYVMADAVRFVKQ